MLRSFRFANHRSFRDEHELLLLPAYDKDRIASVRTSTRPPVINVTHARVPDATVEVAGGWALRWPAAVCRLPGC